MTDKSPRIEDLTDEQKEKHAKLHSGELYGVLEEQIKQSLGRIDATLNVASIGYEKGVDVCPSCLMQSAVHGVLSIGFSVLNDEGKSEFLEQFKALVDDAYAAVIKAEIAQETPGEGTKKCH